MSKEYCPGVIRIVRIKSGKLDSETEFTNGKFLINLKKGKRLVHCPVYINGICHAPSQLGFQMSSPETIPTGYYPVYSYASCKFEE
jgi:hypothetical protein